MKRDRAALIVAPPERKHCVIPVCYLAHFPGNPRMPTLCRALGAATLLASLVAPLAAQDAAELCKSIGRVTVGQWSSYTMTGGKADGAKLRLAIVGQERRGDSTIYSLGISGNGGPSGKGGILQLLVPGFGVNATAIRGMIVKTAGQPAMKMPDQMVSMMGQNMGQNNEAVDVARRCASAQVVGWESVSVPAGSVRALHLKNVDGDEYWVGTTGGGVFKTTDGGATWLPVTDKYFGGTIGAIGVSESNPDVVYVGTGEYPIRGNVSHGEGVWKTTDGGKTWTHVGLEDTHQISRVRVHPTNPDTVWVGAQGHAFGPNADRGVYKTTDGGKTWRKVLFRNDSTGISDLVLDPSNSAVLYAAFWQAHRKPWQLVSGGAGGGVFKSSDGGEHWTELTHNTGLPAGLLGNIGLAVSPAKPARIWALIEADSGGVYRSEDGGATWRYINGERKLRQRPWYYSRIFADPKDTNTVYALNVLAYKSTDGGQTFRHLADPHGDNHDMWIASNDPQRMIEANDGGANVSVNGGKTWTDQDFATAQFYHVTTTNHFH